MVSVLLQVSSLDSETAAAVEAIILRYASDRAVHGVYCSPSEEDNPAN